MKPSEAIKFSRELKAHQKAALDRFAYEKEMALLWEAGAMKTATAIAWLRAKYNVARAVEKTLIVSPVATLYNWRDEFIINSPQAVHTSVEVPYMKTKRGKYTCIERAEIISETDKKIIIINPESFDDHGVVLSLKRFEPKHVIVDEADGFKAHGSKRLAKLLEISDRATCRAIMTGTPILNSYLDIWAQWRILDCGATFGMNFFVFRERYFQDKNLSWKGKPKYFPLYAPKPGIDKELSELMGRKADRVLKKDCLDLPPQVFEKDYVELSPEQEKAYKRMEKEMIAEVQAGTCAAVNALAKVQRLLQIVSGYLPVEHDETGEKYSAIFRETPRLKRLRKWLEELTPNHKVIVWASFSASYIPIREMFKELDIEFAEITGESSAHHEAKERFQNDPKCRVMLANPQAGGIGINLQQADYCIYFARNYSLRQRLQSLARNFRGGSEIHDKITVIDLVAPGTIDEDVLAALDRKENFSDSVLDRIKNRC